MARCSQSAAKAKRSNSGPVDPETAKDPARKQALRKRFLELARARLGKRACMHEQGAHAAGQGASA